MALRKSLSGLSTVVRRLPISQPARHDVELIRDVPYLGSGLVEHTYDVWRPKRATGALPLVVCIHGGAFRALSKETHWIMGLQLARRGLCVVVPNYRLAPAHRYPAGSADAAAAIMRTPTRSGSAPTPTPWCSWAKAPVPTSPSALPSAPPGT